MFSWLKKKRVIEEKQVEKDIVQEKEAVKKPKKDLTQLKEQKKIYREEKERKREENKKLRKQQEEESKKEQEQLKIKKQQELEEQQALKQQEFEKRKQEKLKKLEANKVKKQYKQEEEKFDLFGFELQDLKQGMQIKAKVILKEREEYTLEVIDNFKEVYMLKVETIQELAIDDIVDVLIYRHTNDDFYVSQRRLNNLKVIGEIKKMATNNEIIKGKVTAVEDRNYIIELENGLQGFVYYNNISLNFVQDPEAEIGKEYELMVKEIFPQDKYKVELTRIPLLKEELKNNLDKVAIGSVITIKDFVKNRAGIEFDYEGFKVFIPYRLLSHSFIDAESDISYIIGKEAKIIECEETKFGYDVVANARELEGNPFEDYVKTIAENDEVEGKIIRIEHYGMFLELTPGVKALLHKNDYSLDFIKEIDNLDLGSEVKAKIKRIDEEKKQVDLTI